MEFDHFVKAQERVYDQVVRELTAGKKLTHWMWFIFPQLRGLGHSMMSQTYALESVEQARRYVQHPLLGRRLRKCTQLVICARPRTPRQILGYPDWLKFRSSLTLFSLCSGPNSIFSQALEKCFAGNSDEKTLNLLGISVTGKDPKESEK
jgi:uncharacterized protein (DUF1810 family)